MQRHRPIITDLPYFLSLAVLCLTAVMSGAAETDKARPNILLILADDVGFSDLGCYGGEIDTPILDGLAKDGIQFRQFYNSARCSPTRASIMTGLHPHQAGFPNLGGRLVENSVTLASVVKAAGYRTSMVGKWHLNEKEPPTQHGFDEFYGMLGGYNSCWQENPYYTRWPKDRTKRVYAPDAFYSTDAFADYAIDFIGTQTDQPWFMYLAFNAPHFPLHAPEVDIAKYENMYFTKGWDAIRADRLAKQKKLGLMPADLELPPRGITPQNQFNVATGWADKEIPAWESLPEDRRHDLARRMAVYAGMIDHMDRAIGKVMAHLKSTGQYDNTVIFFLSDNGACAEWDPYGFDQKSSSNNILHTGSALKDIGTPKSYVSYGSGWANACVTPFRLFKHYGNEGGIRSPFIVHWSAGLQTRGYVADPGYITDFMPTVCALADAKYPTEFNGKKILPEEGISLTDTFTGKSLPERSIFIEHEGNRAARIGDWKLVAKFSAQKLSPWALYNLAEDPCEMHDVAEQQPERVKTMSAAWNAWAERCQVNAKKAKKTKAETEEK